MLSLLTLTSTCPCSIVTASSFAFPSLALLAPTVTNPTIHGLRAAPACRQEPRRGAGLHGRKRAVRGNAESESSGNNRAVQPTRKKDGFKEPTKLPIANAPSRSRDVDREETGNVEPLVQERVTNDLVRRYWSDEVAGGVRVEEVNISISHRSRDGSTGMVRNTEALLLPFGIPLPKIVTDFFLPAGFPDTVSNDYLQYMLWQFPTNVTGWICGTLVTSSLFKGLGVGLDGGYAAAATATIKWVSKDGLGAVGLFLIGGRFGSIFDEDPKQWRLYADFIGSAGSIFELCTPVAPDQFLLLGSLGYLFKAVAKGLKDPSFRVIQNHFAVADNVGDVSAKEEVWEESAKLLGLTVGVLLLGMPGLNASYWNLVLVWACLRSLHLWLRYQSLAVVQFPTINYKRAAILVESHLQGFTLPACKECNKRENLLVWRQLMTPRVLIGSSLKDLIESSPSASEVQELLALYSQEDYVLVLHRSSVHGLEAHVLAKEGATSTAILRSLWQAYWLLLPSVSINVSTSERRSSVNSGSTSVGSGSLREQLSKLRVSLNALENHFSSFLDELKLSGWDLEKIVLKVPTNAPTIIS